MTLLCAAWLILFSIPIFLYTPDLTTTGERFGDAMRHGVGNVELDTDRMPGRAQLDEQALRQAVERMREQQDAHGISRFLAKARR